MASETVVIGLNWVGDNILALPTYRALHHRYRHEGGISVAAPEHIATLLASIGIFRKVIAWNGSRRERIRLLKNACFPRAVSLSGRANHGGNEKSRETAARPRANGFEVTLLTSPGERRQAETIAAM